MPSHGGTLTCSAGTWAGDILESFLYRAPQTLTYQWLRNDQPIAGATASSLDAKLVGSYSYSVTATNAAGSNSQTSTGPGDAQSPGEAREGEGECQERHRDDPGAGLRRRRGGPERHATKRKQLKDNRPSASLLVKVKGKKKLSANGKLRVKAKVAYTPTGGKSLRRTKSITLKLNRD